MICVDMDLKRLVRFQQQIKIFGSEGDVYCFGFQKDVILEYLSENIKISEVNFEIIKKFFE